MEKKVEMFRLAPPSVLFRRFGKKKHAEEFLKGEIRLQSFCYYRNVKDKTRRDEQEGISRIRAQGSPFEMKDKQGQLIASGRLTEDIKLSTTSPERYFISCLSTECIPKHRKWGEWVIEIRDPLRLFQELAIETPSGSRLLWGPVEYCSMLSAPGILEHQDTWRRKRKGPPDHTAEFKQFGEQSTKLSKFVSTQLDITTKSDTRNKPIQHLWKLLGVIGLEKENGIKRTKSNGITTYNYKLCKKSHDSMIQIINHRKQNQDSETSTSGWKFVNNLYGFEYSQEERDYLMEG